MNIFVVLIGLAVFVLIIAIAAFFWAVNNKQFDDLDSPAYRVLFDDKPIADDPADDEDDAKVDNKTDNKTPDKTDDKA